MKYAAPSFGRASALQGARLGTLGVSTPTMSWASHHVQRCGQLFEGVVHRRPPVGSKCYVCAYPSPVVSIRSTVCV